MWRAVGVALLPCWSRKFKEGMDLRRTMETIPAMKNALASVVASKRNCSCGGNIGKKLLIVSVVGPDISNDRNYEKYQCIEYKLRKSKRWGNANRYKILI